MNKHVSTGAGLVVVIAIILAFGAFYFFSTKLETETPVAQSQTNVSKCQPRAFMGEAKIKGWYVKENSKKLVQVADEDLAKLPAGKGKIQIIDADASMEKNLNNSTKEKPGEITITGFAVPCNDVALASISYKDGIFRPFLKN